MIFQCKQCGVKFRVYPYELSVRKYCSLACKKKAWIPPSYWAGKKLPQYMIEKMSKAKKGIRRPPMSEETKKKLSITHKGKEPWSKGKIGIYSEETLKKMRGQNSPAWRGGLTSLYQILRNCVEYKIWRIKIFERDDYTCQKCFKRGWCILQADHIKPFALIMAENNVFNFDEAISCKELWEITNGRTLCKECHKTIKTHGLGTRRLLEEYRKNKIIKS